MKTTNLGLTALEQLKQHLDRAPRKGSVGQCCSVAPLGRGSGSGLVSALPFFTRKVGETAGEIVMSAERLQIAKVCWVLGGIACGLLFVVGPEIAPCGIVLILLGFLFGMPYFQSPKKKSNGDPAPPWFLPAGIIAIILGILGFLASAAQGGGGDFFGAILAGALNPLFFVGLPLGVYWLTRIGKRPLQSVANDYNLNSCYGQMMRGATNRAMERLAKEVGAGPATGILAVALAHACYPRQIYGDGGFFDSVVVQLKQFACKPCNSETACSHVEQWLDFGSLSTADVFQRVWGLTPDRFIETLMEGFASDQTDVEQDHSERRQSSVIVEAQTSTNSIENNQERLPAIECKPASAKSETLENEETAAHSDGKKQVQSENVSAGPSATAWASVLAAVLTFGLGLAIGLSVNRRPVTESVSEINEAAPTEFSEVTERPHEENAEKPMEIVEQPEVLPHSKPNTTFNPNLNNPSPISDKSPSSHNYGRTHVRNWTDFSNAARGSVQSIKEKDGHKYLSARFLSNITGMKPPSAFVFRPVSRGYPTFVGEVVDIETDGYGLSGKCEDFTPQKGDLVVLPIPYK